MESNLATEKKNKKQLFICLNDTIVSSKTSKVRSLRNITFQPLSETQAFDCLETKVSELLAGNSMPFSCLPLGFCSALCVSSGGHKEKRNSGLGNRLLGEVKVKFGN